MWIYLSLVSRANLSRIESKSEREKVIKAIKNLDDNIDLTRESWIILV